MLSSTHIITKENLNIDASLILNIILYHEHLKIVNCGNVYIKAAKQFVMAIIVDIQRNIRTVFDCFI